MIFVPGQGHGVQESMGGHLAVEPSVEHGGLSLAGESKILEKLDLFFINIRPVHLALERLITLVWTGLCKGARPTVVERWKYLTRETN